MGADSLPRQGNFGAVSEADKRKRYRDPNDVERSCHNLRAGTRVLAGNLHPAWEVDRPRRRASVRKVTYWPHILLLKAHIAVTPFGSYLVRFFT
jgi:hypothetical protein